MYTEHVVSLPIDVNSAFDLCRNVEVWPQIFPPCLDAKIIAESDDKQHIALTALANGKVFSWKSERDIDLLNKTIRFEQTHKSPLVEFMKGEWKVNEDLNGSQIVLTHTFDIKDDINNLVAGVNTESEAIAFMRKTVDENSTKELEAIRKYANYLNNRHEFSEKLIIPFSKSAVFKFLRDVECWPDLLSHCQAINMLYEDEYNQEFEMVVSTPDYTEHLRSIRYIGDDYIRYFQPVPPPVLKEHRGLWSVKEVPEGIEVISWHEIVLSEQYANEVADIQKEKFEKGINRASLNTMKAILNKLQGGV